jgi:MFS family permease
MHARVHDTPALSTYAPMQVTGMGALVVTPIVGNLSDRYGRKALMTLPVTVAIAPLCKWSGAYFQHAWPAGHYAASLLRFGQASPLLFFFLGSYTGMRPLGGVLLRVLRGQDHRRGLLRGHHALSLPCLRGKNYGSQLSKSRIYSVYIAKKRKK